jgi:hypothetical protein
LPTVVHNNDPVAVVDKVDDPQLLTTVTVGAAGAALTVTAVTADVAEQPSALVAVTE